MLLGLCPRRHPARPGGYLALGAQLPGWRYLQTALTDSTDYSGDRVDDSAWATSTAPFGNLVKNPGVGDKAHSYDARFANLMATTVPLDASVWLRRQWVLQAIPPNGYTVRAFIDNTMTLYINGSQVMQAGPMSDGFSSSIPASAFRLGVNTLAVRGDDDAEVSQFDASYFDFVLDPNP